MTHRTATLAALMAALMAGTPAFAQSTTEAETKEATEAEAKEAETTETEAKDGASTEAEAKDGEAKEGETAEAPPVMEIEDLKADTVVLTINGKPITLGEVIAVRQTLPEQYQGLPDEILMGALVQQLADQQMLADAAEKKGLVDSFNVQLALKNQRRATLADAYMSEEMVARISDEVIQKAYEERFANVEPVVEVRASHILVKEEAKAKELKKQLDEGADFAALAAEHGTDGTKTRGGDLGYFVKEQMVPEFANAAFALEKGQVSDPVQSPFGWHLIYLADKRNKPIPPLEAVRDQIVGEMSRSVQEQIVNEGREGAKIEEPALAVPPAAVRLDKLLDK